MMPRTLRMFGIWLGVPGPFPTRHTKLEVTKLHAGARHLRGNQFSRYAICRTLSSVRGVLNYKLGHQNLEICSDFRLEACNAIDPG